MPSVIQADDSIIRRFSVLNGKGRLAHAYLFIGPPNIGKFETARSIAKAINCEQDRDGRFCDTCPSCVRINAGQHPDIMTFGEDGEPIKIGQIRELLGRSKFRPHSARKKVFVLRNIETMTLQAANAFLKTLEEPDGDSLLLLTTSVPEKSPDTIRSRCHAIHFRTASVDDLTARLKDQGLSQKESHFIAYFAQGCPGTAQKLHDRDFVATKDAWIDSLILSRPGEPQIKEILADKTQTKEFLDVLYSWIRDCLLVKAGIDDARLIHLDRLQDLKRFAEVRTFEDLDGLSRSIVNMYQLLADNLNIKLPLLIIGEQLWEK